MRIELATKLYINTLTKLKLKAERARTWSSCAAHSTKATRTVREALLQQSLAGSKCYRTGEWITEPDWQGGERRAGYNRQSKT